MLKKKIIPIICLLVFTLAIIAGLYPRAMPFGAIVIPMTSTGYGVNLPSFKDANRDIPWITEGERLVIVNEIKDAKKAVWSGTKTPETAKYFEPEVKELLQDISVMLRTNSHKYNFFVVGIDGITPQKIRVFRKTFSNAQYVAFVDLPHGLDVNSMNY